MIEYKFRANHGHGLLNLPVYEADTYQTIGLASKNQLFMPQAMLATNRSSHLSLLLCAAQMEAGCP